MRTSSALLFAFMLTACERHEASSAGPSVSDEQIECAIGGQDFVRDCGVERDPTGAGITIWKKDGGFRRFERDEQGVLQPADGADSATQQVLSDGRIELSIGGDRFRLADRP